MPSHSHLCSRSLAATLLLSALMAASRSGAQVGDPQTVRANALFATAKQQQAAGHLAAACASFEESYQLAPRGGTLINMALCHRQLGELVVAREELLKARDVARRDGQVEREALADDQLATLEHELSWVDIAQASDLGTSAANVSIDGDAVANERVAQPIALMPGEHTIRIEADGFDPVELRIALVAGARTRVPPEPLRPRVLLPPAAPEPSVAPARVTAPTPPAAPDDSYRAWRTAGLVLAIAGIAGGLSAGAWALERKSVVQQYCDSRTRACSDQRGLDAASLGRTVALASTVACSVGLAGFGVWLFLPGGVLNDRAPAATGSAGLTWAGSF